MKSAVDMIAHTFAASYPDAPYEWLEKAAKETIWWGSRHVNPTTEQFEAQKTRINNMLTTGEW